MKPISRLIRAADIFTVGSLFALAGCAGTPTREASMEATPARAFAARGDSAIEPPTPLRRVAPEYPWFQKSIGITGVVNVNCLVDENGRVQEAKVDSATDTAFSESALRALEKWTFRPGSRDGVPVPMWVNVPVNFTFSD